MSKLTAVPDRVLRLLEQIRTSQGEARQKLADDNAETLRSELATEIAEQRLQLQSRRIDRLEKALATVRRLQEAQAGEGPDPVSDPKAQARDETSSDTPSDAASDVGKETP